MYEQSGRVFRMQIEASEILRSKNENIWDMLITLQRVLGDVVLYFNKSLIGHFTCFSLSLVDQWPEGVENINTVYHSDCV